MLDLAQNIAVLLASLVAVFLFTFVLDRVWPAEVRRTHNDLIGWQLGTLGTTYAVILGFMLYTVWTDFGAAQLNADLEASSLRNVYSLAAGLPAQQAEELRRECRLYVDSVINNDWPDMDRNQIPDKSHPMNQAMWKTLMSVKTAAPTEVLAEDHALYELSNLTDHRRTRILQCANRIPIIFWIVLGIGALVTVASSALFGARNRVLHTMQIMFFAALVTLVLLAIEDVNRPFTGWIRVSNYAFIRAQQFMGQD